MIKRVNEDIRELSFEEAAGPLMRDARVRRMLGFIQHGSVTTYAHCVRVARLSWDLACKLHADVDARDLVAGALLHDFYLYDWHDRSTSKPHHATRHPLYAADNAREILEVNQHVASIIQTHMWPLPPTRVPASTEAWIVCAADKLASLQETLFMRRTRRRNDNGAAGSSENEGR